MKNITYLFDFDGTLVDSMPSFVSVMLRILDENNVNYENDIVKIITPLGYAGTAQTFEIGRDPSLGEPAQVLPAAGGKDEDTDHRRMVPGGRSCGVVFLCGAK